MGPLLDLSWGWWHLYSAQLHTHVNSYEHLVVILTAQ